MIDSNPKRVTIELTRREDRAMLRSNPSARSDAEAWRGVSLTKRLPPASSPPSCFGPNAINLNPRCPANIPHYWLAVGHMSRFSGLGGLMHHELLGRRYAATPLRSALG